LERFKKFSANPPESYRWICHLDCHKETICKAPTSALIVWARVEYIKRPFELLNSCLFLFVTKSINIKPT